MSSLVTCTRKSDYTWQPGVAVQNLETSFLVESKSQLRLSCVNLARQ